jgi:YD repeat-containing protein
MSKTIIIAAVALAVPTGAAQAQQRTYYDSSGKRIGSASTDSQGTVTNYEARDRVISRESTSGNTTTIYSGGRNVGRFTTTPQR